MSKSNTPGAVPRGLYAVYRGNLGGDPKTINRERPFVSARMGVNMAGPDVSTEERDGLTEWVNVIAFSDALREKLMKCRRGEQVTVMGNVTLKFYQTGSGETRVDRTIVADALMSAASSYIPPQSEAGTGADAVDPGKPPAD